MTTVSWSVRALRGEAGTLHDRVPADPPARELWLCTVTGPAIVLGSVQPDDDVDRRAAADLGVAVVRRRSGGGAVLLDPQVVVWVDALVPRGDPLWDDDVGKAFGWFGRAWARTLAAVGVPAAGIAVHDGPLVTTAASSVLCFAGLGPGEVTVDGAKVVGLSQRRTRSTIRLQASLPLAWDPVVHAAVLGPGLRRVAPGADPVSVAGSVRVPASVAGLDAAVVADALVAHLPGG